MGRERFKEKSTSVKEVQAQGPASVEDVDPHTVFVRSLPFTLTDSQLEDIFSEVGPVRHCFTIKEKGSNQHRGFGFVQFAVTEDAHRAVKEKNGASLQGRKIKVEIAKRRAPLDQRRPPKPDPPNPDSTSTDQQQSPDATKVPEPKKRKSSEVVSGLTVDTSISEERHSKKVKADSRADHQGIDEQEKERGIISVPGKVKEKKESKKEKLDSKDEDDGKDDPEKEQGVILTPGKLKEKKESKKKSGQDERKDDQEKEHEGVPAVRKQKETNERKKKNADGKSQTEAKDGEIKEPKEPRASEKQRPARTVVIGGLLNTEMFEAIISVAKSIGPVESIQRTFSQQELNERGLAKDGCKPRAGAIVFLSVKAAMQAVAALHQKSIGGGVVWARQLGGEGSKLKKLRLIVRNLPFLITEPQLRELFSPAGFLWEVTIPRKPDGMSRGFAFVGFTNKADAEKAIKDVNGKSIGKRPVAVDWAVGKKDYDVAVSAAKTAGPAAVNLDIDDGDTTASDSEEELEEDLKEDLEDDSAVVKRAEPTLGRNEEADKSKNSKLDRTREGSIKGEAEQTKIVALDEEDDRQFSAVGKKGKKKKHAREEVIAEEEGGEQFSIVEKENLAPKIGGEVGSTKKSSMEDMDRSEEIGLMEKVLNKIISSNQKLIEDDANILDEDDDRQRPTLNKTESTHKIVSNSAETSEKLNPAKKAAEPVQAESKADGTSMGRTLFIRNLPPDAKVPELRKLFSDFGVVKSLRMVLHPVTLRPKGTAFLEYASKEAADTAIAAASTNGEDKNGLMVKGRVINVDLAVDRDAARNIAKDTSKKKDDQDRRNLGLAKEGFIQEGTPAAEGVSKKDLQKRQMLEHEKSTKLRSPNFHVSKMRLSVHNVPKGVTEKALKKLFIEAVKSRASKQQPVIKQVKILRDEETGKTRGTAFIEFTEHQHALVALRVLNNNPTTFGTENRPIVEFAVENSLILRKRAVQLEKSKNFQVNLLGKKKEKPDALVEIETSPDKAKKGRKSRRDEPERKGVNVGEQVEADGNRKGVQGPMKKGKNRDKVQNESGETVSKQDQTRSSGKRKRKEREYGKGKEGDGGFGKMVPVRGGEGKPKKVIVERNEVIAGSAGQSGKGKTMNGAGAKAVNGKSNKSSQSKQRVPTKQGEIAKGSAAKKSAVRQSSDMDESSSREKRRQKKLSNVGAAEDRLDKLVTEYRTKYFSDGASTKSKAKGTGVISLTAGDLRRWFE